MNWFNLVSLILAMSQPIVQAIEVIAQKKAADGTPITGAQKAAAGVQLANTGLMIAGAATGNIPGAQIDALIKTINDGTVAQNNAATAAAVPPNNAPPPVNPMAQPPVAPND